jgi:Fe-S-cluster containining protein
MSKPPARHKPPPIFDDYSHTVQLAGKKMVYTFLPNGSPEISFNDTGTGRSCGDCQLCCKLLPVPPLHKAASVRCGHQRAGKGCAIYPQRPLACRLFSCRWLADPDLAGMPRPDRCHYVVDIEPDYVTMTRPDKEPVRITVQQIWVDLAFPDAWRSDECRALMARMAERYRIASIIRWNSRDAVVVFPPAMASDHQWHEERGNVEHRNETEREVIALFNEGSAT